MVENLLDKWAAELVAARSKFEFECKFDPRLATPDYAKWKAAYTAFSIADQVIKAAKALDVVIEYRTCPECSSPRPLQPGEDRCEQCEKQDYTDRHTTNPTPEEE